MKRNLSGKSTPVSHIALSDGLAAVSVFIEPISKHGSPPGEGLYQGRGAIYIYTRTVSDNSVTTVGEVPPATVIQIGNSVTSQKVDQRWQSAANLTGTVRPAIQLYTRPDAFPRSGLTFYIYFAESRKAENDS